MKSAQEILAEETLKRTTRENEERRWNALVRRCRYPRGQLPFVVQLSLAAVLIAVFAWVSPPGDHRGIYIIVAFVALVYVPLHLIQMWRKERALLTLIQQYAPELHQRLEREHVA